MVSAWKRWLGGRAGWWVEGKGWEGLVWGVEGVGSKGLGRGGRIGSVRRRG